VEVPILWVRTGNMWVRFEPIKRLKKPCPYESNRKSWRDAKRKLNDVNGVQYTFVVPQAR